VTAQRQVGDGPLFPVRQAGRETDIAAAKDPGRNGDDDRLGRNGALRRGKADLLAAAVDLRDRRVQGDRQALGQVRDEIAVAVLQRPVLSGVAVVTEIDGGDLV
jgi:hypothetical protein